ncbi:two component transcriptional regulator, LuxR family [Bifidobacterium minimum]|uniref:Two component transcriptional regulator, LuxR family n=2 Tax=Bifidobacterium minimum TaxID=1693 RepID=A0A087BRF9_9BIFI|nr:two component transcriptional regulator, LuxR family [Bifidobacterium minimum]
MIRMVIADDHRMVREGIKSMLMKHADLEVVGEASNGEEAVGLVRATSPDLLLLDLRMPDMNGPEVSERVLSFAPTTKIVILTTYDSDADILPAIEAGANSYLLKDVRPAALADAIRDTMAGRTVLDSHAIQAVTVQLRRPPSRRQGLSAQELRVLRLAADGMTNRQIARSLFIGETTVKTYFTRIFAKLEVNDRTSAVARMMADHPDDMD